MTDVEILLYHSEHPLVFLAGGSDVKKVIQLCQVLNKSANQFLIAGNSAYTFLYSRLIGVGNSDMERNELSAAFQVIDKASYLNKELLLPIDHLAAEKLEEKSRIKIFKKEIPHGFSGVDIGPKTISLFQTYIKKAKSIVWYGSSAAYPKISKNNSNLVLLKSLLKSSAYKVLLGKEAAAIARQAGVLEKFNSVIEDEQELLSFSPIKKVAPKE